MVLTQKTIEIKVVPATRKYWEALGYDTNHAVIAVDVNHLPPKSNFIVECLCDTCNRAYMQRWSRNKDICGSCITSARMWNNNIGKYKVLKPSPPKVEILKLIREGKGTDTIAKKYSVSIPVVKRWLKEYDITLVPNYGRLYFKTDIEKQKAIIDIKALSSNNATISEISTRLAIPKHIVNNLRKTGAVEVVTVFSKWEQAYSEIIDKISFYETENYTKNLKQISNENGISIEHLKKAFQEKNIQVKLHSYNKSSGELECKEYINSLGVQCHSAMFDKKFEIDCYVPDKKFGIEYCGEYWHRFKPNLNNKYYHKLKMEFVAAKNINLMTIFESEWKNKQLIVKSMIANKLGLSKPIYARKCVVYEIFKKDAEAFHAQNHLSSYCNSSINIGISYNGEIVAVLSLIKSRFDMKFEYEIARFSSKLGYNIVGGLGKAFSYFVNKYKPKSCMTYVDLRIGKGDSYTKIGFTDIGNTPPNYFYFKKGGSMLESRLKYQKHKLKSLIGYDANKTEYEIMEDSGYFRIYDCGNRKLGWIPPQLI